MHIVHLIIAVPGSGKTWVCNQLKDKFTFVPHDDYPIAAYGRALIQAARTSHKPVLAEAPFRASLLVDELENAGLRVEQHYLIEHPHVVRQRYEMREGKPIPKQHMTNLTRYAARARRPVTATQLLERLKCL
jgi:hypothetical protein